VNVHSRRNVPVEEGQPEERTAQAWERTAFSTMLIGALMARQAAVSLHWAFSAVGLVVVALGSGVLIWAEQRYDEIRRSTDQGSSPVHPTATRVVGVMAIAVIGVAAIAAIAFVLED
jgi:uncharacterized membrane protein YidH (DUF202 family)